MPEFSTIDDRNAIEAEGSLAARGLPATLHGLLAQAVERYPDNPAVSFQILSEPDAAAETLTWRALRDLAVQAANLFRGLGIGPDESVGIILPNCSEAVFAFLGAAIAGRAVPINPMLPPTQIAAILREANAKAVVTLRAFPQSEVAAVVGRALAEAPDVRQVFEVDLSHYLSPPKSWLVPLLRPRHRHASALTVRDFRRALGAEPATLTFDDSAGDRVAAHFHTGGTTGTPKLVQHRYSGMIFNGWLGKTLLFNEHDTVLCPLPLFHVFAVYPVLLSMISSGAHMVMPTPQGYRGKNVFKNYWKLVERWKATFMIAVPTAISALMQHPVNADISTLRRAFSGSSSLPLSLFRRFEQTTGVEIAEGYGLTEATCLVSCNPITGTKKIGSVGLPFPFVDVRIRSLAGEGPPDCAVDEIGEICVASPGLEPASVYTDTVLNANLAHHGRWLRTGDLGRIDADGYLWIAGRSKDVIIRGGQNIDPAMIEEVLTSHDAVAVAGAVGQPDRYSGEVPCVYVELASGQGIDDAALLAFARNELRHTGAAPRHLEILSELPKTAVGKVFKPELRRRAIVRIFDAVLQEAKVDARVTGTREDKQRGLIALVAGEEADRGAIRGALDGFQVPWELVSPAAERAS